VEFFSSHLYFEMRNIMGNDAFSRRATIGIHILFT